MSAQPDWDLTAYFPGPASPEMIAFRDQIGNDAATLQERAKTLGTPTQGNQADWVALLAELEQLGARYGHLSSFLGCMAAADATDDVVAKENAGKARLSSALAKTMVTVRAALAAADSETFASLVAAPALKGASYSLTRMRERAKQAMPAPLEELAADLGVNGISAWGRLYNAISGKLTFELQRPGSDTETLPVAMVLTNLCDSDPNVRRATAAGAAKAWEGVADTVAACLNAIAGTRLSLYEGRDIDDFLAPALFDAGITRATLDALFGAIRSRQSLARRYLKAKAKLLGVSALGFHDLLAPLPGSSARISWAEGVSQVENAFACSYPELSEFAQHAIKHHWIDHSPRVGKRPGGFCTSSKVIGESRIFMTYNGALGDVQTLAHELGHAFHSHVMNDMRPWQRSYPMTLAETASTFAEQLITDAALAEATAKQRLAILDQRLLEAAVFTLNIPMRFDFEHELYKRRASGELSVTALKEMMLNAQRANYGDALADDQRVPCFWASKLHSYITDISFYNFPYSFGYLFSLGLFARSKAEGPSFLPTYRKLLRRTGSARAEDVAKEVLGVSIDTEAFWNSSHDLIEADLVAFENLVAARVGFE